MRSGEPDDARIAEAWSSGLPHGNCPEDNRFYEAARGALTPRDVHQLLDHAASCPACALALRTAAAIHEASDVVVEPRTLAPTLWQRLASTLLRPEAALAYLLLLAIAIPAYRAFQVPAPSTAAIRPVHLIGLESETVTRGERAAPLVRVTWPAGETPVLQLFVERDDLEPGAPLRVTVGANGRTLSDETRPASALDDQGRLDVAVDPSALPDGELHLEVRSGSSVVFARTIRLDGRP